MDGGSGSRPQGGVTMLDPKIQALYDTLSLTEQYDVETRIFLAKYRAAENYEKPAVIKGYVSIVGDLQDRAKAERRANDWPEICSRPNCGVKLSSPGEVISGVCVFCRSPRPLR
jgi:hypothetical protein